MSADDAGEAGTGNRADGAPELDATFIAALDARMAKSDLEELGWHDRDDIDDVMRDLRLLAYQDWQRAADLWNKYRPDDIDKPDFIDGNDVDEKREQNNEITRGVDREVQSEPDHERADDPPRAEFVTPEALRKRYLQAGTKYFFRAEDNKLAFEESKERVVTKHDDPEVIRAMVLLAEAKGWRSITVKGSEAFEREAWLQASLLGLDVQGYKPRDVDLARVAEVVKERGRERAPGRDRADSGHGPPRSGTRPKEHEQENQAVAALQSLMRGRGDSERAIELASVLTRERFQTARLYVGTVIEHGEANFQHMPGENKSYYVKLKTASGERVVWGTDLKRAIDLADAKTGDDVVVAHRGRQPVAVMVKDRDAGGRVIGQHEITATRNVWDLRKLESLREDVKDRVAMSASKDKQPLVKVYDREAPRAVDRPSILREAPSRDQDRVR